MTQPLGYYADTAIPVIADLEQEYGSMLEGLTSEQKIFLIYNVAEDLENSCPKVHPQNLYDFTNQLAKELTEESDTIALLKALVNSL